MLRFLTSHYDNRAETLSPAPKRYSRYAPKPVPERIRAEEVTPSRLMPVTPPADQRLVVQATAQQIDENSHLYADTRVSVATLRQALPGRFAALHDSGKTA